MEEAFTRVIECEGDAEAPDCSVAIAAAEVVAALRQQPGVALPEEACEFVARIATPPPPALIGLALQALEQVKTKSELQALWDESDSRAEWRQAVSELEGRLR